MTHTTFLIPNTYHPANQTTPNLYRAGREFWDPSWSPELMSNRQANTSQPESIMDLKPAQQKQQQTLA